MYFQKKVPKSMRYGKIFLLHFQYVFENRSRSFVWFLISLFNPLILLFFYKGATSAKLGGIPWSITELTSYYFFLVVAAAFLTSHVEEDVSREDIQEGALVKYLVKPFSYYWINFLEELPYRVLQGAFGVFVIFFGSIFLQIKFNIVTDLMSITLSIFIIILAYMLSFTFKMIIGLFAFWTVDIGGLYQLIEAVTLVFGGYIVPLAFMPDIFLQVAKILPFSYMIYFPITSVLGIESVPRMLEIIVIQSIWLGSFLTLYVVLWQQGLKKFTAVGQ